MIELGGTLEDIGLASVLQFVLQLGRPGCLTISDGMFTGTLYVDNGSVVGASFQQESGLPALESIGLALSKGRFTFSRECERQNNVSLPPGDLEGLLERIQTEAEHIRRAVPLLSAAPRLLGQASGGEEFVML